MIATAHNAGAAALAPPPTRGAATPLLKPSRARALPTRAVARPGGPAPAPRAAARPAPARAAPRAAAAAADDLDARLERLRARVHADAPEAAPQRHGPIREFLSKVVKGAACAAVAAVLLFGNVRPAAAAGSAGRVGGFVGDTSAPTRSSGGGGGYSSGGYGGGGYGGGRGYGGGYSGGTSVYVAPAPSPYYGGSYVGGYTSTYVSPPVVVSPFAAPAVGVAVSAPASDAALDALLLMGLAFVAFSTVSSTLSRGGGLLDTDDGYAGPLAVTKVQVGLLAVARDLKCDLDAIAESADTSTNEGLKELLGAVTLALLRNPDYWEFAGAQRKEVGGAKELEREYNSASLAERSKFTDETLVNVRGGGGVRRARMRRASDGASPDELIVVTLLVASKGALSLPKKVDSADSLRSTLRALGGLPAEQVLGVEVLWTPQAEGDVFSREDLTKDYPSLRVI